MKTDANAVGAAIKVIRLRSNITQASLARLLQSITSKETEWQPTISRIETGTQQATIETLTAIAKALGTSAAAIMAEAHQTSAGNYAPVLAGTRQVPLLTWVSAGAPAAIGDAHKHTMVPTTVKVGPTAFALSVRGQSMTTQAKVSFPDGTVIIVDPHRQYGSGSLVIARFEKDNEATFKRFEKDGGQTMLVPLNPAYPVIPIVAPCQIVGVVVSKAEEVL
jgi:SOS-response transcriptional repressor LexA